jgi:hypothetical protein
VQRLKENSFAVVLLDRGSAASYWSPRPAANLLSRLPRCCLPGHARGLVLSQQCPDYITIFKSFFRFSYVFLFSDFFGPS